MQWTVYREQKHWLRVHVNQEWYFIFTFDTHNLSEQKAYKPNENTKQWYKCKKNIDEEEEKENSNLKKCEVNFSLLG